MRRNLEPERKRISPPALGVIKMISGGPTDGDSNRARKAQERRDCMEVEGVRRNDLVISFGPDDLQGVSLPHNDALVIHARVSNYDVMRVFVDTRSSINVIFKEALVQMDLQGYQLEPIETALFGFAGHVVYPEGEIILPLTLGTQEGGSKKAKREEKGKAHKDVERVIEKDEVHFVAEEEQEMVEIEPGKEIRVAEYSLNVMPGSQPVKQKKRHFGPEKDKVDDMKFRELLKADHIQEVGNGVLVPKATRKWRMCVEFRDLNKVCPKDHYPLPRIYQLVDSTSGYELLSFMDAYQGYHQIPLAQADKNKASFIISGGTFCYLGRNIEVYVDDILGKSREASCFIVDMEEKFATLRRYGIRLNPTKCIFGVKSGKFLGLVVTDRGIEVNSEKVKAVLDMSSPQSIREAFRDLKSHLAELPVLVKLEPEEKLFVYLSTTEYAVSLVLIREEGYDQKPVYYVSHALIGAELRYSEVEKIVISLIMTARKLRPYFLSYPITVFTNSPPHSEVSGSGSLPGHPFSDSQLITQQIKGAYEAKDERMLKYLKLILSQAEHFVDWSIEQILREENNDADA
ncbi:uncharacterized protein LOC142550620 [Primulina tabacum]|uniref:uncharacterized protein LOC142550620 n=1 Tax=Primulina tabacum TaxID=48773 RepID=UPI003F59FFF3